MLAWRNLQAHADWVIVMTEATQIRYRVIQHSFVTVYGIKLLQLKKSLFMAIAMKNELE